MLRGDLQRLSEPYPTRNDHPDKWLADRLAVAVPNVDALASEILSDLDPKIFGVGWWATGLDTRRRIFIGDCLYQAVSSIGANLIEARLHLLELAAAYDDQNRMMANAVSIDEATRQPRVRHPRPQNATEQIPGPLSTLHAIGSARALNSALDCLGAAIVGVGALPVDIQRASFGSALFFLRGRDRRHQPNSHQLELLATVDTHTAQAGPRGWLEWLQRFRHMAVHRGRRLSGGHLVPRRPALLDANGRTIIRVDVVPVLPSEPEWCDVQAFLGERKVQLAEPALTTLTGLLDSVLRFAEAVSADLLILWRRRRLEPTLLAQPGEQWPDLGPPRATNFEGYAPGSAPADATSIVGSEDLIRRLEAAALADGAREQWPNFD